MRKFLTITSLGLLACSAAWAQKPPCARASDDNAFLDVETIRLWPAEVAMAKDTKCEDTPTLTVFEPQEGRENGSAVIVLPGGSYTHLSGNVEGRQVADWFAARGFHAFVLSYRLPENGYNLPVPLLDARRAVQTVRARARDYQIEPNRIVLIGFSAGGHLAALAATKFVAGKPEADDPVERVSSRPDYLVLGYPWIGAVTSDISDLSYCQLFNLMDHCDALRAEYSPEMFVTRETPPTFWFHTFNDPKVPMEQGLRFYEALVKAGVPAEAHVFASGPHGFGLGGGDAVLDQWPGLLENWLRAQGLLERVKAGAKP